MFLKRAANFISLVLLLAVTGCGDDSVWSKQVEMPAGPVKVKFSDESFPAYLTVTGLSEAKSWGRRTVGDKVKLKFGSALPSKFVLTISAKAADLNMPVPVKVGGQIQTIKLDKKKLKPVKLTFTTEMPTDLIEIEIPQTVIKGRVKRMTIALVGFELEAAQ